MAGELEWPNTEPDDLLVVCNRCFDEDGLHTGVFAVVNRPDGAATGRMLRRCAHSDSPPDFAAVTAGFWASWQEQTEGGPMNVMVREVAGGGVSWTVGRRADVLRSNPRS